MPIVYSIIRVLSRSAALLPFPFLRSFPQQKVNAPENLHLVATTSDSSPRRHRSSINSLRSIGYRRKPVLQPPARSRTQIDLRVGSMASSLAAAPAAGYPPHGNQAVAVTAASNGAGNPYVLVTPASATPSTCQSILKALSRYGKLLEDGTRKAADTTGNIWHHLRTAPNMADAAVARLAQGTKVYAEGGHDRVFHQVFGAVPGEQLRKAYACYLSTSSGPVIGTLYLSTARLAFCSDSPLPYHGPAAQPPEPMYYKVVLPLNQVRTVSPSASMWKPAERYIQIATMDNHEFWFMGFVSYDKALRNLSEALHHRA